jgi:signal transduction histidine kinase
VVLNLSALAQQATVQIHNQVSPDTFVMGLPAYIESIITNFITNGIKYRREGDSPSYIRLSTAIEEDFVRLLIEDNGLGIDLAKYGKRLYEMYATFHKHKDAKGIGLFITKNQVEAMGGSIDVESEPGKGSRFIVSLRKTLETQPASQA